MLVASYVLGNIIHGKPTVTSASSLTLFDEGFLANLTGKGVETGHISVR